MKFRLPELNVFRMKFVRFFALVVMLVSASMSLLAQDDDKPAPYKRPEQSYSRDTVNADAAIPAIEAIEPGIARPVDGAPVHGESGEGTRRRRDRRRRGERGARPERPEQHATESVADEASTLITSPSCKTASSCRSMSPPR